MIERNFTFATARCSHVHGYPITSSFELTKGNKNPEQFNDISTARRAMQAISGTLTYTVDVPAQERKEIQAKLAKRKSW